MENARQAANGLRATITRNSTMSIALVVVFIVAAIGFGKVSGQVTSMQEATLQRVQGLEEKIVPRREYEQAIVNINRNLEEIKKQQAIILIQVRGY